MEVDAQRGVVTGQAALAQKGKGRASGTPRDGSELEVRTPRENLLTNVPQKKGEGGECGHRREKETTASASDPAVLLATRPRAGGNPSRKAQGGTGRRNGGKRGPDVGETL